MASDNRAERVASLLLAQHSLELISCRQLQSLWAGYGSINAIKVRALTDEAAEKLNDVVGAGAAFGDTYPLILKLISPPEKGDKAVQDEGHLRKMLSYEIEQYFYTDIAPNLAEDIPVAKVVATTTSKTGEETEVELKGLTATIMTDLRPGYPIAGGKREQLSARQARSALDWLAKFHGSSWEYLPTDLDQFVRPPLEESKARSERGEAGKAQSIWLNGGYTYLATRRTEYKSLEGDGNSEWSKALCTPAVDQGASTESIAEMVAAFLTPTGRPFETYIHGDVKSENLFATSSGAEVAFFDFQYVGLGLGVCDLAKLFTCSVPLDMLIGFGGRKRSHSSDELTMGSGEKELLEQYCATLKEFTEMAEIDYPWDLFVRHWETALVDWCRFQASWGFWGNTEWLEARVRSILKDEGWRDWLKAQRDAAAAAGED